MGQRPTNQKSKAVTSVKCQQYVFGLEASDKTAKVVVMCVKYKQ